MIANEFHGGGPFTAWLTQRRALPKQPQNGIEACRAKPGTHLRPTRFHEASPCIGRSCSIRRTHHDTGARRRVSVAADQDHRANRRRWTERHRRASRGAGPVAAHQPERRRREPHRSRRRARHRNGRQRARRWTHAAAQHRRDLHGDPAFEKGRLRPGEGLHRSRADLAGAAGAGREHRVEVQDGGRFRELRQDQPRQAHLRLGRRSAPRRTCRSSFCSGTPGSR